MTPERTGGVCYECGKYTRGFDVSMAIQENNILLLFLTSDGAGFTD